MRSWGLVGVAILLGMATHVWGAPPEEECPILGSLRSEIANQGVLVFAGAEVVLPEFAESARTVLGSSWRAQAVRHLAKRVEPGTIATGQRELETALCELPRTEQAPVLNAIVQWVSIYRVLESLERLSGPEAVATAVAFNPALADLFPRDREMVQAMGREAGASLASGELFGLTLNVTTRLAQMDRSETVRCLGELYSAVGSGQ